MEKNKKTEEIKEKTPSDADIFDTEEDRNLTIDDIENAPDDPDELFTEPPTLDIDFDEEPTDDELKLEEMDVFFGVLVYIQGFVWRRKRDDFIR